MDLLKSQALEWAMRAIEGNWNWLDAAIGLLLLVVGTAATNLGGKLLKGSGVAFGRLTWAGLLWLGKPKPIGETASMILATMMREPASNPQGHGGPIYYGKDLHMFADGPLTGCIFVGCPGTLINPVLTKAERKRIAKELRFDKNGLAEQKVRGLGVVA